jgi:hypothetical protein
MHTMQRPVLLHELAKARVLVSCFLLPQVGSAYEPTPIWSAGFICWASDAPS